MTALPAPVDIESTIQDAIRLLSDIESNGNPEAVNVREDAVGLLQIRPIMVEECNRILKRHEFTYRDRRDEARSRSMAEVFLNESARHWRNEYGCWPCAGRLCGMWNAGSPFRGPSAAYREKIRLTLVKFRQAQ